MENTIAISRRISNLLAQKITESLGQSLHGAIALKVVYLWVPGRKQSEFFVHTTPELQSHVLRYLPEYLSPYRGSFSAVTIKAGGRETRLPEKMIFGEKKQMTTYSDTSPTEWIGRLHTVGDRDLEREVWNAQSDGYISGAIITMDTHKGVFCDPNVIKTSGANRVRWTGENMKAHHIPEELSRYLGAIYENAKTDPNGSVLVEYVAPNFDGRLFRRRVSVRLVHWGSTLCRLVKAVEINPI